MDDQPICQSEVQTLGNGHVIDRDSIGECQGTALGVCDHEADRIGFGCALEQIGFQPEAGLTGAASPDD